MLYTKVLYFGDHQQKPGNNQEIGNGWPSKSQGNFKGTGVEGVIVAEILNTAAAIDSMGRWNPSDLAFLENLEYRCGIDGHDAKVMLVGVMQRRDLATDGWPSDKVAKFRATIFFDGVCDLAMKGFGKFPKQIMGFDIIDASSRGWKGIAFAVEDYENGVLQFHCRGVQILDVVPVKCDSEKRI